MPDPVKAPPRAMVDEIKEELVLMLKAKYNNEPKKKVRCKAKLKEVCEKLAYIQAFLKFNEIEIK